MRFTYLFISIVLAELIAVSIDSKPLEYLFKPAIMLALGIYFFQQTAKIVDTKQRNRIFAAIFFSLIGDIILMFPSGFIFGLTAFLIAHLCYIYAFMLDNNGFVFGKKDRFIAAIGILAYAIVFLSFVLPKVGTALQIPIAAYGITILSMLLTALNRWKSVENTSFQWVLIGAIVFVFSDSLLAVNRFVQPVPFAGIGIMLAYSVGQFFIIKGVLKGIKS
jgi:uncharacterized membrane protein YhhN